MNEKLLASVRYYFAQSVFNTSCHYKAYERIEKKKRTLAGVIYILTALTVGVLILQIIGLQNDDQNLLGIVAFIGMLLTGGGLLFELMNKEDLSRQMFEHRMVAEKYKSIRDQYMGLIEEVMSQNGSETSLRKERDRLQIIYTSIGESSPTTTSKDFSKAQSSLGLGNNTNEEYTWSSEEINRFLPAELRI